MKYTTLIPLVLLLLISAAYASNSVVLGVSLCSGCTPAATPTATATPGGGGGSAATADPNAFGPAQTLLSNLESVYGNGSKKVIQSVQFQFGRDCCSGAGCSAGTGQCAQAQADQVSANGGIQQAGAGVDFCSINEAQAGQQICDFATNGTLDTVCTNMWAAGGICIAHSDFPNTAVAWANQAIPHTNGVACAGAGQDSNTYGSGYDCSGGMNATFISEMLTQGTTQNNQWNTEIDLYVPVLKDLQNKGIPIIMDNFQESDGTSFWWAENTTSQTAQLYQYVENRWESEGVHNVLYDIASNSGVYYGFPGCGYVDISGWDNYSGNGGGPYLDPHYTNAVGVMANCGKSNAPMGWPEYGALSPNGGFISQVTAQPHLVFMNAWSIGVQGQTSPPATSYDISSDWLSFISNPYNDNIPPFQK